MGTLLLLRHRQAGAELERDFPSGPIEQRAEAPLVGRQGALATVGAEAGVLFLEEAGELDLASVGEATLRALLAGRPVGSLVLTRRELLGAAAEADATDLPLADAIALAVGHLHGVGDWSSQTAGRLGREMARLAVHLEHHGVSTVSQVSSADVDMFARGATNRRGGWSEPSVSTMHLRLTSARLLFRCLRALHVTRVDPTLEVRLPARSALSTRPLTDEEELVCRLTSEHTLTETRRPIAWALGQATATTVEQAAVHVHDVDLPGERVWLAGNGKRAARWGRLSAWGVSVIGRAIEGCADPDAGLVYRAQRSAESGAAAVCIAVGEILADGGYGHEPDVRPGSLPAWAGRKIFEETGRIEVVASRLGLGTLDAAARVIAWDWRQ